MASSPTSRESEVRMSRPSFLLAGSASTHSLYTNGSSSAQPPAVAVMAASFDMVSEIAWRTLTLVSATTPSSRPAFTACWPAAPTAGHTVASRLRRRSTAHICRIWGSGKVRASSRSCGMQTGGFALCCSNSCSAAWRAVLSGLRNCGITSARLAISAQTPHAYAHSQQHARRGTAAASRPVGGSE